jgi:hypothetical protein
MKKNAVKANNSKDLDQRPLLWVYWNGSRGDFLASILVGNILMDSFNQWHARVASQGHHHLKMHRRIEKIWNGPDQGFFVDSLDPYKVIRIRLESVDEIKEAHKLAAVKMADRNYAVPWQAGLAYEQEFALLDATFFKIIPYRDLWDLDRIKDLFQEFRGREMTLEEENRILKNIVLNLNLLQKF